MRFSFPPNAAFLAKWHSPYRLVLVAALILVLAAVWLERYRCLAALGGSLVEHDPLEPADIAFVLNGGENTRPGGAAALYRAGFVQEVVIARENSISNSAWCRGCRTTDASERILRMSGVPESRIVELQTDGGVRSTFDEASSCLSYFRLRRMDKIIVVTSDFHSRRAKWIFARLFSGTSVKIMVDPIPKQEYSVRDWWHCRTGRHDCWKEYLKLAYYFCRYGLILPAKNIEGMKIVHL